jgi:hypothetical protein
MSTGTTSSVRGGKAPRGGNFGSQSQAPLNPERPPQLLGKYAKYIGKDLESIEIRYSAEGVEVHVNGLKGSDYADLKTATLAEFRAMRSKDIQPTTAEKLRAFRNKYELRLNKECNPAPKSGSDADIQTFLDGLNFHERRAMLMTQKQFQASYPNGYTAA